eukprot:CAMPEP_0115484154 /NCGR_PEP_ID=MMETSP0271-20121206/59232_1 /TAXON_ID=71861 /ORGANISM="Scrippsiella trochoidea, Strain CCMP3099" /LENGTH=53 /DNA_ID=CAMNT_0002912041 /DNA_START=100 /DNA_END=261 /DNA_ORIENTATION=+
MPKRPRRTETMEESPAGMTLGARAQAKRAQMTSGTQSTTQLAATSPRSSGSTR